MPAHRTVEVRPRSLPARIFWTFVWVFPISFYVNSVIGGVTGALGGMANPGPDSAAAGLAASQAFFVKYGLIVLACEIGVVLALAWRGLLPGTSAERWRATGEVAPDQWSTAAPDWKPKVVDEGATRTGMFGGISLKAVVIAMVTTLLLDTVAGMVMAAMHTIRLLSGGMPQAEVSAAVQLAMRSTTSLYVAFALGTLTTVIGGFIAAVIGKRAPYRNAIVFGLLGCLPGLYYIDSFPAWYNAAAYAMLLPASLLGALMAPSDARRS